MIGFVGQTQVLTLQRVYPKSANGPARQIDYRHVIHSLAAKPQAFRFLKFREELLPDSTWGQLWHWVDQQLPQREACKWMVGVLRIAGDRLHLQAEPDNEHDPRAVEVLTQTRQKLGYLPRHQNARVAAWLKRGLPVQVTLLSDHQNGWLLQVYVVSEIENWVHPASAYFRPGRLMGSGFHAAP